MVCRTANYIAAARAVETEREGGIINDPWARPFAGPEGFEMLRHFAKYRLSTTFCRNEPPEDMTVMITAIRTKFIDHNILSSMENNAHISQIVILGCGYDTRSCRLDWPRPTIVYEVDLPEVINRRTEILGTNFNPLNEIKGMPNRAERVSIALDVTEVTRLKEQLIKSGFKANKPTIWVMEGLLTYLQEEHVHNLLHLVSELTAPDSIIIGDTHNVASLNSALTKSYTAEWAEKGAPLIWGTDEPESVLHRHGFLTTTCCRYGDKDANFGRYPKFLNWVLENFPRSDKLSPNTLLFVAIRDNRFSDELWEWRGDLLFSKAEGQVEMLKKWILAEHLNPIIQFLEFFKKHRDGKPDEPETESLTLAEEKIPEADLELD